MSNQTVKLKKDHTHEGVKYDAGTALPVTPADADWLISNGIADPQPEQVPEVKREAKKA